MYKRIVLCSLLLVYCTSTRKVVEAPAQIEPEQICVDKFLGKHCWFEMDSPPKCYWWTKYVHKEQNISWSGACPNGRPHGNGTYTRSFHNLPGPPGTDTTLVLFNRVYVGRMHFGEMHGSWYMTTNDGESETKQWYEYGRPVGSWLSRSEDGTCIELVYESGKLKGIRRLNPIVCNW